jgi:UDP-2-acetamido-2,6-beta-L-arabino-hexul-4-ose reductase
VDAQEGREPLKRLRIGITGASGFLGWHTRALLHVTKAHDVVPVDRVAFANTDTLAKKLEDCDAVMHLAGMNRGEDAQVREVNEVLAHRLAEALAGTGKAPHLVFANSTHSDRNTAYGVSKRNAALTLRRWAEEHGARFTNLVIPHIFGECGRPFYNSAVATFCHQLAHSESPSIIQDGELELIHAQEVARAAIKAAEDGKQGDVRLCGRTITVSGVLDRLTALAQAYRREIIPAFAEPFDLDLFNTLRSYLYPQSYPVRLTMRADPRGGLFEAIKTLHGGQCFISTTRPGITRGNHCHLRKIERFLVLQGEAVIRIRRLLATDVVAFPVSGAEPAYVDMPTLHTHSIANIGSRDLVTLFWANEIFDPEHPDTYPEAV